MNKPNTIGKKKRRQSIALSPCALAVGLAAADPAAEKSLTERAQTFWDARVKGDWSTVYRFLTQEEQVGVSAEKFVEIRKTRGPFAYRSAKIGEVTVAGNLGWVEIDYTAQVVGFPEMPARDVQIWDIWQKRNGQWYPIRKEEREQVPHLPPLLRSTAEVLNFDPAAAINGLNPLKGVGKIGI